MTSPTPAPVGRGAPWTPDQPLRHDATDEQMMERWWYHAGQGTIAGSDSIGPQGKVAREFAAACVAASPGAGSPEATAWTLLDEIERYARTSYAEGAMIEKRGDSRLMKIVNMIRVARVSLLATPREPRAPEAWTEPTPSMIAAVMEDKDVREVVAYLNTHGTKIEGHVLSGLVDAILAAAIPTLYRSTLVAAPAAPGEPDKKVSRIMASLAESHICSLVSPQSITPWCQRCHQTWPCDVRQLLDAAVPASPPVDGAATAEPTR